MTKALIIEGQPLFCRGLASLIESLPGYHVAAETANLSAALEIAEQEKPALIIIDISLDDGNGMKLIPHLKTLDPEAAILVLSMYDERYYSERVFRLGALGYIMKDKPAEKVIEAIQTVMSGKIYLSNPERDRIFEAMTSENIHGIKDWAVSVRKLSNREFQIFSCIGKGLGTIEIATKFKLSTKTIDTHKEHIKLKLHCNTSQELRQLAIEWSNHQEGNFA